MRGGGDSGATCGGAAINPIGNNATDDDAWMTPRWFVSWLHTQYRITLDACASEANAVCARYYDKAQDGLSRPWTEDGWTFCNPPYQRGELPLWCSKAIQEARKGRRSVVLLPASDLQTEWARDSQGWADNKRLLTPRLRYESTTGKPVGTGPSHPSMLWEFRGRLWAQRKLVLTYLDTRGLK
jgi:phage N-6-adenine-methyltransferase